MTRGTDPPPGADASGLDRQLSALETGIYRSLIGVAEACREIAARAEALGLAPQGIRARLLASDAASRLGEPAAAQAEQLALHAAAAPWPALARRAAMYLASTCDRLGQRVEAIRWAEASVRVDGPSGGSAWHAEALMVAALFSVSRDGADYALVDQAMAAVRGACDPILEATTAANFAEVAAECGELVYATHYADLAEAAMRRHPEAASALSWESVARARLAASELAAAEHAMKESLQVEEQLGCCDINGDPWLSYAEVRLARLDPAGALAMLDHPRRLARGATSAWTHTRDLRVRARVLAALQRWQEAYDHMVQYAAAYERSRSIAGDRAVAESSATMAIVEERRRALHFERLSLTDPLTGLPNRRHAERWLAEHALARGVDSVGAEPLCVAIADLDHFKRINDTHSHDAGDLVLQRFGTLLQDLFDSAADAGASTLAARLGGEEFLLAWAGIPTQDALRRCNELRERLRATSFTDIVGRMPITVSIGLVFGLPPADSGALLRAADRCLYEAKRAGRDRVVWAVVD
ncbi:MAG TPA: GGDEF domain-containing protein [Burkholderiaceae bacterium]|nr:GGDEF domain-containing protein [Burkholderiaceae bacterium]